MTEDSPPDYGNQRSAEARISLDAKDMTARTPTLGQAIVAARKAKGISQKDLAAAVQKDDGTGPISPQYLNDIEHDRRSPTSDQLIREFAKALDADEDYLFVLAGKIPDEVRREAKDPATVAQAFRAFRRNLSQ
ncbi:helix-turn-helix domain-containing protein [Siccirubricoccus phaeus]|uniref:helix-turn-helix domain-containing protein n=1 Tax=Siccirubricoccus phaeus TaxID=2595053 RepID=UPI001F2B3C8D|nr:helix-turn-helix transcriptional regulator [Siccirubricoccus phaeus]